MRWSSLPRRCIPVVVILSAGALACSKWSPVTTPTAAAPATDTLARYRVTTRDAVEREFTSLFFRNDSLLGAQLTAGLPLVPGIAVRDIAKVEQRKFDGVATGALVGSMAVLMAVAAAATMDDFGPSGSLFGGTGSSGSMSCPLIYSWDGTAWRLDSGTFGGAITPALARTDMDNLLHARPFDGVLTFRMTAEAPETEHVDALAVLAVDHPHGTTVAPDARANTTYHVIGDLDAPIAARDRMRPDVLPQLAAADGIVWEPRLDGRDPNDTEHLRDGIELTFARPAGDASLQLVIDGQNTEWAASLMGEMVAAHGHLTSTWYDPATTVAASTPMVQAQRTLGFLTVLIWDGSTWRHAGEVWEAGPEVAKRQVLPIDVRGIPGTTLRIRLESAPAFWTIDFVGLGLQMSTPVTAHTLHTISVTSERFADGFARLAAADGVMLDMEQGDVVGFTVADAPPAAPGMTRSYLLRSTGWYRVHGRDHEPPMVATLAGLADTNGPARLALLRLNEALALVTASANDAHQR